MDFLQLFLIGVGLSMDAFAVSICKGLKMRKVDYKYMFLIALFFGGFQALMPFIGWFLGKQFQVYITAFDHWIAFILLLFVGGKMALEAIKGEEEDIDGELTYDIKEIFVLAVATSIDALAVGITFAFLQTDIWSSITIIGITTFLFSILGVFIGNRFGVKYKNKAEITGGIILMGIGAKILIQHLGLF